MSTPYKVPVKDKFEWQSKVKTRVLATPPVSPTKGDRYILPSAGLSGAWVGHGTQIAECSGPSSWDFIIPSTFFTVWVEDEAILYNWNGSSWVKLLAQENQDARRYALLVGGP
jgi:hypothetical protein